ncbi:uncharacterized protein si:ch211-227n13.3 isoform X1 [Osmerus eperlanus]|uniref:uncharacterized protein si:ch211-227n13.3 isoform X1 n=2 Tax=Osmerus eperlanus TaxID=29151 RepID=UPI002E101FAD
MVITFLKRMNHGHFEAKSPSFDVPKSSELQYTRVRLQYSVSWRVSMRSLKPLRHGKKHQETVNHSDAALQARMTGRQQTRLDTRLEDSITDNGLDLDIIDCIDKHHYKHPVIDLELPEQQEVGADSDGESDADSCCSLDSKASGPSYPWDQASLLEPTVHPDLCSGCQKLFREAKKSKTQRDAFPITVPSDLSCDQWVLKKPWRPRRLPNTKGRLWTHVGRIRKRQQNEGNRKQIEASQLTCSRPHIFLQRILRGCVRQAVSSGRRRGKRKRRLHSSDRSAHVAKQHRLDCDPGSQNDSHSDNPEQGDSDVLILDVVPKSVTMETPPSPVREPKPEVRRKKGSFRDLLAQLSCNRSIIVQEAPM